MRVFQQFATLDLLSGERAEIMAGRGSFIESFPLFGYALDDYDPLFDEKLRRLLALRQGETVTWSGRHRAPIDRRGVYPRPVRDPLPVWVAVGGTPASVVRAGTLGLPMALAIIGGRPARFAPHAELLRTTAEEAGHGRLPLSINARGLRPRPHADPVQRRHDAPRPDDAQHRVVRRRGGAGLRAALAKEPAPA